MNTCYLFFASQEKEVEELLERLYKVSQIDVPTKKISDVIDKQEKEMHDACTSCYNIDSIELVTLHNIMNQMKG